MLGPYIKSRGTRGTKMSANADLITVETYVQQGETILKPFFHLWAKMLKKCIFWGPCQLSSHPYLCTCEIRKQSDDIFKFKPKI